MNNFHMGNYDRRKKFMMKFQSRSEQSFSISQVESSNKLINCLLKSHFLKLVAKIPWPTDATTTIAMSTVNAALSSSASAIIVVTLSDQLSYLISKYRPRCPIIAVSSGKQTTRQARLYHGILPLHFPGEIVDMERDVDERLNAAIKFSKNRGLIKRGDSVIIVTSWRDGTDGTDATNTMRLAQIQ